MSDTSASSQPTRSSLLYAFGKLTAETANHANEIARLREAQEAVPAKVIAGLAPQLTALQRGHEKLDRRVSILERRQWLVWGGGATILGIVGYVIQLRPHL